MGRLLRFLIGVALILVGVLFGLRFGEQAYYSLGGTQTAITIDGSACRTPRVALVEAASRCTGDWTVAGRPGSGDVIGADASLANQTVTGWVVSDAAVLPLSDSNRWLGSLSPLLVLVGLGVALTRRRRARRYSYAGRRGGYDTNDYGHSDYDSNDHGGSDSDSGGDGGGD
jgi:hypothetical protein